MAEYLIQDSTLINIANAIREKTGKTSTFSPNEMANEISNIEIGVGLNFAVVGGTTRPSSPSENTIWVNTNTEITGYYFSATQPANMKNGEVWITTGTASNAQFNALDDNSIMIYPLVAKQMVSGALKAVTAKTYLNGEWVEWMIYLFNKGDQCVSATGGWTSEGFVNSSSSYGTVSATIGNTLQLSAADGKMCMCGTVSRVQFGAENKTLHIKVTEKTGTNGIVYISTSKDIVNRALNATLNVGDNNVDISSLASGNYYIVFLASGGTAKLTIETVSY